MTITELTRRVQAYVAKRPTAPAAASRRTEPRLAAPLYVTCADGSETRVYAHLFGANIHVGSILR